MARRKRILVAFGTRPEALKLVPLIQALRAAGDFKCTVCLTGQHRQMVDQVVGFFKIQIDYDLRLMRANQSLEYVSGRVVSRFGKIVRQTRPDLVFVQGDTATALMVGIASFYSRTPIAHLEAGLRTRNKFSPYPEEMNRTLLSHLADYHFTPTPLATRNLVEEGIRRDVIFQVGNTIVDTVRMTLPRIKPGYPIFRGIDFNKRILFVTAHRRESFGEGLRHIFAAFKQIVAHVPDVEVVYPVHLNPHVAEPARKALAGVRRIHLLRPLTVEETYSLISRSYAILTDSGGIQEEAPSFHKPVLVLRNVTERTEGIRAGVARLVGTQSERIVRETERLLRSPALYRRMINRPNPYGDGRSSRRILKYLRGIFH